VLKGNTYQQILRKNYIITAMRILVIEDEPKIANSLKQGLEQEGFAVDVTNSGREGYDMASVDPYDLILLDRMLPEMDGMEVCRKLKEKGNYTPVLMLTAKGELKDKIEGLNCGADDYLTKPFAFTELLARIKALLRRPDNLIPNKLKCGDLEVDTISYTVRRGNKEIELSKTEFSLLEYLLRNKGTVLSKEKIIQHVWDYDADVLPNTVEVYMGYLRNKIEKPFKNEPKLLKTIRGFGYKAKEPKK